MSEVKSEAVIAETGYPSLTCLGIKNVPEFGVASVSNNGPQFGSGFCSKSSSLEPWVIKTSLRVQLLWLELLDQFRDLVYQLLIPALLRN